MRPASRVGYALGALLTAVLASAVQGQNGTVPGEIRLEATQVSAGIEWSIEGDQNQNCVVTTRFRALPSGVWRTGQPLLRVEPGFYNSHQIDPGNLLAGSLFDLVPARLHEVQLVLSDPDGGSLDTTLVLSTRAWPGLASPTRTLHVIPGSGGGSGSPSDPFRGIPAADAAAQPGDLILLASGVYADSLDLLSSGIEGAPIVWSGVDRDATIIDGQSLPYSLIELQGTHDVMFRNLTLRNPGSRCVLGSGTRNLTFSNLRVDFSVRSGREMFGLDFRESAHQNIVVSDCEIVGPLDWAEGRDEDHYALILIGTGHVVRHNRIHGVYDGIMVGGDRDGVITSNCDIYGNEVYDCTDDGIEFDASRHNIRCFDNRFTNVLVGFSCQPVYGGPIYILRNVVYNWQLKPLKFHGYPTGMIVAHNTLIGADPRGWGGGEWRKVILRNNLILGGSQTNESGPPICLDTRGLTSDLDYDGWYQAISNRFARFNNVSYPTLAAFQAGTGFEQHGVLLDHSEFVSAPEPQLGPYLGAPTFFPPYPPGAQDVGLVAEALAVDAGTPLPNLNDGWLGNAPDLGAYERGRTPPAYGPGLDPVAQVEATPIAGPGWRVSVVPNPVAAGTRITWGAESAGGLEHPDVQIRLIDVAGRTVRTARILGATAWDWDGRDDRGRPAVAGWYRAVVEGSGRRGGATVLLLPSGIE